MTDQTEKHEDNDNISSYSVRLPSGPPEVRIAALKMLQAKNRWDAVKDIASTIGFTAVCALIVYACGGGFG